MDKEEHKAIAATIADPQFKAGRSLVDAGRLEEAADFFSGLLEVRVGVLGDEMNPALAPLYYEYGNALLYNAEESGAVFGDAITEAEKKRALDLVEAAQNGTVAETRDGGKPDEGDGVRDSHENPTGGENGVPGPDDDPAGEQGTEQDLVLAWENLEIARRLYSSLELTDDLRTLMAKVHLRLGDLQMVNGLYNEAAEEFSTCLSHRLALSPKHSRGVADAHVRRAQALFYASTLKDSDKNKLVVLSLEHYQLAAKVLEDMLSALASPTSSSVPTTSSSAQESGSQPTESGTPKVTPGKDEGETGPATGSAEEIQDVLDTIRETIETMKSGRDMEALAEYRSDAVSTTVGFGGSSGSSVAGAGAGSAAGVTTNGFGVGPSNGTKGVSGSPGAGQGGAGTAAAPSSSVSKTSAEAGGNVMLVKRKGRPTPRALSHEAGATGTQDADVIADDAKRAKTGE